MSKASKKRRFQETTAYVDALADENRALRAQNATLKELQRASQQTSKTGRPRKKQRLDTGESRTITTREGLEQVKKTREAKEAKEKEKNAGRKKRADQAAARERDRAEQGENVVFRGKLTSKQKPDLQDIAYALEITDYLTMTKDKLLAAINSHFEHHPDLRTHARYMGLFTRARAPRQPANPRAPSPSPPPSAPSTPPPHMDFPPPLTPVTNSPRAGPSTFAGSYMPGPSYSSGITSNPRFTFASTYPGTIPAPQYIDPALFPDHSYYNQ